MNDKELRVETAHYDNGTISSEVTYLGEHIHGVTKTWHPNGSIESEVPMVFSKKHGISRHWNQSGKLLGMNVFVDGTGTFRSWYDDGQLQSEMTVVDGVPNGWQRCWDESGALLSETFFSKGKMLKRKSAIEKIETESSIPTIIQNVSPVDLTRALGDSACRDARELLRDRPENWRLGENLTEKESSQFLKDLYASGAKKVLAALYDGDAEETDSVGMLAVELPASNDGRDKIFAMKANVESLAGIEEEKDVGQEVIYILF